MAISEAVVRSRLLELERRVARLRALDAARAGDDAWRDQVERNLQIGIQALLDLGAHVIAERGWESPPRVEDVFRVFGRRAGLAPALVERLTAMARLRNLLVHNYLAVDGERLVRELPQGILDLSEAAGAFRAAIGEMSTGR